VISIDVIVSIVSGSSIIGREDVSNRSQQIIIITNINIIVIIK